MRLLVKGAILDQQGRNAEARQVYGTAPKIAPNQPSLHANLGLSVHDEQRPRQSRGRAAHAVKLPGALARCARTWRWSWASRCRFEESRALFAAELPSRRSVEAQHSAYIRSMLTQQNRWDLVKAEG